MSTKHTYIARPGSYQLTSSGTSELIKHRPQYSGCNCFQSLQTCTSYSYGFSPDFLKANGATERAVRTIKDLLNESDDPYLAILA